MSYFDFLRSEHNWPDLKIKLLNKGFFQDFYPDFQAITTLSKVERAFLEENVPFSTLKLVGEETDTASQTSKVLFQLQDGKKVESVLMRFRDGRNSVCVSTQVGCPVGCVLCASGQMGFMKNLTAREIVDQVMFFARKLGAEGNTADHPKVSNVVYMGMGEPMLNYKNVVESVRILTDEKQLGLSPRRITMSSSGYIKQLEDFMLEGLKTRQAISLHGSNQELRAKLMPVAKAYSLDQLFEFLSKWENYSRKRITYQYIMIKDVNDSDENARELAQLLQYRSAHVNLIPMNAIVERPDLTHSSNNRVHKFATILQDNGIEATIRVTMGDRIQAACGQLANKNSRKA